MPIHDWTVVDSGLFHHFHLNWIASLATALNSGCLPDGFYALAEQRTGRPIPDLLALHSSSEGERPPGGGVAVAVNPPRTRYVMQTDEEAYVLKANRIVVRHRLGEVVAVIEIVSPGNKQSQHAIRSFIDKAVEYLFRGVHLLIVDLFPPTSRDPQGLHPLIWSEVQIEGFSLPADKPLTLASYVGGIMKTAYVEPVAVGDELPSMPLFLTPDWYVPAPLAETYELTWNVCPKPLKDAVLHPSRD